MNNQKNRQDVSQETPAWLGVALWTNWSQAQLLRMAGMLQKNEIYSLIRIRLRVTVSPLLPCADQAILTDQEKRNRQDVKRVPQIVQALCKKL